MNWQLPRTVSWSLLTLAMACNDPCKSTCEALGQCPNAVRQDCASYCRDGHRKADDTGCSDQFNAYIDCLDGLEDLCKVDVARDCNAEFSALNACEGKK